MYDVYVFLRELDELDDLFKRLAVRDMFVAGDAHIDRHVRANGFAHSLENTSGSGRGSRGAAVIVCTLVRSGGEELGQEIGVRGMDENHVEAASLKAFGAVGKAPCYLVDLILSHGFDLPRPAENRQR
jgi:hypothetical protein